MLLTIGAGLQSGDRRAGSGILRGVLLSVVWTPSLTRDSEEFRTGRKIYGRELLSDPGLIFLGMAVGGSGIWDLV